MTGIVVKAMPLAVHLNAASVSAPRWEPVSPVPSGHRNSASSHPASLRNLRIRARYRRTYTSRDSSAPPGHGTTNPFLHSRAGVSACSSIAAHSASASLAGPMRIRRRSNTSPPAVPKQERSCSAAFPPAVASSPAASSDHFLIGCRSWNPVGLKYKNTGFSITSFLTYVRRPLAWKCHVFNDNAGFTTRNFARNISRATALSHPILPKGKSKADHAATPAAFTSAARTIHVSWLSARGPNSVASSTEPDAGTS